MLLIQFKYMRISGFDGKQQPAELASPSPKQPLKKSPKKKKKNGKQAQSDDMEDVEAGAMEGAVGSVAGGGRYDNLVNLFSPNSPKVPCVGVSFGIERLLAISEMLALRRAAAGDTGVSASVRATETEVMVIVAHKGLIVPRLQIAQELWNAKIKVHLIVLAFISQKKIVLVIVFVAVRK